jgi:hypothetical protein
MPLKHKSVNNFGTNRDILMIFLWLITKIMVWNDDEMVGVAASLSQPMRNHFKLGVSLRVLYCVVDTGYGLGRSLGDCRPALPED